MATKKKTTKKTSRAMVRSSKNVTNLAICYLPFVGWIPAAVFMVLETDRKVRWHAMQALLTHGVVFAIVLVVDVLLKVPVVLVGSAVMLVVAYRIYHGQDQRLPMLASWTEMIVHKG
jgi:uncharacterized membrane protein